MTRLLYASMILAAGLCPSVAFSQNDPGATVGDTGTVTCTYRGHTVTYITVRAADNKIWLQQNLGSTARATSATDTAGYGHLFQWGRWDDGHQLRNSAVAAASTLSANNPSGLGGGTALFYNGNNPNDWWSAGAGTDTWSDNPATASNGIDPCAAIGPGWHMPSQPEWANVLTLENVSDVVTGFGSNLRLTAAGMREANQGNLLNAGLYGNYWAATPSNIYAKDVTLLDNGINDNDDALRSYGFSVRCMATCTGVFPPQGINGPDTVCARSIQTFSVPPVSNADSYGWTFPAGWTVSGPANGSTVTVMTGTAAGTVSVSAANSCGSSTAFSMDVAVAGEPDPQITASGNTLSTGAYESYQWLFNEVAVPGATAQQYTATISGNYRVRVTDGAGCVDTSAIYNHSVVGISAPDLASAVSVYPNPATTVLYVQAPVKTDIVICSPDGREVLRRRHASQADVRHLAAGIYQVRLYNNDKLIKVLKLTINR